MNKVGKVCRGMERAIKYKLLGLNAKRRPYEGVVILTVLVGAEHGTAEKEATEYNGYDVFEKYVLSHTNGLSEE